MKIAVYHRSVGTYAGGFLIRQGNSLDATHVSGPAPWPTDVDHREVRVPDADALTQRATTLARGAGISVGGPPSLTRRLHRVLSEFDITYTMFLGTAFDLYPLSRRGITYVVHAGGSDITTLRGVTRGYRRASIKVAQRAAMVLVGSRFLQDRYRAVDPATETVLHYIGVDVPDTARRPRSDDFRVVAASRLHPVKGVDRTIKAFTRAFRNRPDARLDILGDGPERRALERLAIELGVAPRVSFHGQVPARAVDTWISGADVFVQHNVTLANGAAEALGGSILEASARGVPVVATRSGGVPEAVLDGETGLLTEEEDVEEMAHHLSALYDDSALGDRLGLAGRRFVQTEHNSASQDQVLSATVQSIGKH